MPITSVSCLSVTSGWLRWVSAPGDEPSRDAWVSICFVSLLCPLTLFSVFGYSLALWQNGFVIATNRFSDYISSLQVTSHFVGETKKRGRYPWYKKKKAEEVYIYEVIYVMSLLSLPLSPCSGDNSPTSCSASCWSSFYTSTTTQYLKLSKGLKSQSYFWGSICRSRFCFLVFYYGHFQDYIKFSMNFM